MFDITCMVFKVRCWTCSMCRIGCLKFDVRWSPVFEWLILVVSWKSFVTSTPIWVVDSLLSLKSFVIVISAWVVDSLLYQGIIRWQYSSDLVVDSLPFRRIIRDSYSIWTVDRFRGLWSDLSGWQSPVWKNHSWLVLRSFTIICGTHTMLSGWWYLVPGNYLCFLQLTWVFSVPGNYSWLILRPKRLIVFRFCESFVIVIRSSVLDSLSFRESYSI